MHTTRSERWSQWLPLAGLALAVIAASLYPIRSTDVFWHLATGRWMAEHSSVPTLDPFRFSVTDLPWVNHEWLFQLLLFAVERLAGWPGLQALRGLLMAAFSATLYVGLGRIRLGRVPRVLVTLIAVFGIRPRSFLRPELITLTAIALLLILLREVIWRPRNAQRTWRIYWPMALLTVVWANFHGEALLAPALSGLYLLGTRWRGGVPNEEPQPASWGLVFGVPTALILATFCTPNGWRILQVPGGITGAMRHLEAVNPEWLPTWKAPQPTLFAAFLIVALLCVLAWKRAPRRILPSALATVLLAGIALTAVRHQALFFVGAAFLGGESLRVLIRSRAPDSRFPWMQSSATAALCLMAAAWFLFPPVSGPLRPRQGEFRLGFGIQPGRFPERAVEFLERHPEIGPLYNTFAHGGYLLWRLYPPRQVFHEGRMELQPTLLREIGRARADDRSWRGFLRSHGAVGGLVRYDPRPRPVATMDSQGQARIVDQRTSNSLLFPRTNYSLVYWDDQVMLYLDRDEPKTTEFAGQEYLAVDPEDLGWTLRQAATDVEFLHAALRESERKLTEDPGCQRAAWLRGQLTALQRRR